MTIQLFLPFEYFYQPLMNDQRSVTIQELLLPMKNMRVTLNLDSDETVF